MRFIKSLSLVFLFNLSAYAAEKPGSGKGEVAMPAQPTTEQRESMAKAHEQMAACLRSTKPIDECHQEMMQSCKQQGGACPMMGGHEHHGMMKGKAPTPGGK